MNLKVCCFVRMSKELPRALDFCDGNLHINTIAYFRENGYDKFEGIGQHKPTLDTVVKVNGQRIPPEYLAGPIQIDSKNIQCIHVFCMSVVRPGDFDEVTDLNTPGFRKQLEIDSRCFSEFGDHAVIIHKPQEFINRVHKEIKEQSYNGACDVIEYIDPKNPPQTEIFTNDPIFYKHEKYSYQKEFRIAIETGNSNTEPLKLNVGDLKDITVLCPAQEVNDLIYSKIIKM